MACPSEVRLPSPDPGSHSRNVYDTDTEPTHTELDETDDDDMDFNPQDEDSEDLEFFETLESADADFEGSYVMSSSVVFFWC